MGIRSVFGVGEIRIRGNFYIKFLTLKMISTHVDGKYIVSRLALS
jgi:hypothetical protein